MSAIVATVPAKTPTSMTVFAEAIKYLATAHASTAQTGQFGRRYEWLGFGSHRVGYRTVTGFGFRLPESPYNIVFAHPDLQQESDLAPNSRLGRLLAEGKLELTLTTDQDYLAAVQKSLEEVMGQPYVIASVREQVNAMGGSMNMSTLQNGDVEIEIDIPDSVTNLVQIGGF